MASCVRIRWPPAMWPISCATTPINSPGLSLSRSNPVWMNNHPARYEGVERTVLYQCYFHTVAVDAGDFEDWLRVSADDMFDLGVTDELEAPLLLLRFRRRSRHTHHCHGCKSHGQDTNLDHQFPR